ncbi:YraN family protein [Candidatus Peregrinibacteria bacterium]|nr:YraN family protein [Candidatus Peregrinibacteria bacterium]
MPTLRRQFGDKGEDLAVEYLKKRGYTILDRNFQTQRGEIDIIAEKDKKIFFVEVKSRRNDFFGDAIESITDQKKEKIYRTAFAYLEKKNIPEERDWQIDVITIDFLENPPKIEYYESPFF